MKKIHLVEEIDNVGHVCGQIYAFNSYKKAEKFQRSKPNLPLIIESVIIDLYI